MRRVLLTVCLLAAVIPTLFGLKKALIPDNALTVWFLETDPLLATYHEFHETFGNDEVILLAGVADGPALPADAGVHRLP